MTFRKKFITIFLLLFLSNCGFTPMYKNITNLNLNIEVNELSGNRSIYNLISSNLKNYSFSESEKTVKINMNTAFEKIILAKDSTGKTTDYQIKITAIFDVQIENLRKDILDKDIEIHLQKAFIRYNDTQDKHRKGKTWRSLLPELEQTLTNNLS